MSEEHFREIFSKNLNYYMNQQGIKQSDLVKHFHLAKSTISSWCTGVKLPRMDKIEALARFLNVNNSDLLENKQASSTPLPHRIPILGQIAAGLPLYAAEQIEGYTYTERNGGAEYFALKVKGDSMTAAGIKDGDTITVRRQPEVDNGDIAVVLVNKEDATVKRFKQDGNTVQLIPQSFNPEHQIQIYDLKTTDIEIIGKVVESKTEF